MIWTELIVSRRTCCVVTFDDPDSGAAKYQVELALMDAGDKPGALLVLQSVTNTAAPMQPDERNKDLALATILIESIPDRVFAAEPTERDIKVHLDDTVRGTRRWPCCKN